MDIPPNPAPPTVPPPSVEAVRDQDKMMLFLCYFGVFAVIPYAVVKDSDYVRWHAKQGITFVGAAVLYWVGMGMISVILGIAHLYFVIPVLSLLNMGVGLGLFILWLLAFTKALKGERWRIPIIGDFADRW